MKNFWFQITFVAIFISSCKPGQILRVDREGATFLDPIITSITTEIDGIVVEGSNLENMDSLKIKDPNSSFEKTFAITSNDPTRIVGKNIETSPINANILLDLVLSRAEAQTTYPITFIPGPDSVITPTIADDAVTNPKIIDDAITTLKIQDSSITTLKLSAPPGSIGDVLSIDINGDLEWIDPGIAPPPGGGGGVTLIGAGVGLVGTPNPVTDTGLIEVNTGETGDPTETKIPFFNSNNELVLDTSGVQPTKLLFKEASSTSYSITNDGSLRVNNETSPNPDILVIEGSGNTTIGGDLTVEGSNLFVDGKNVCLDQGGGCPTPGGVDSVTAIAPLEASGTTSVVISAKVGVNGGELVQLLPGTPGLLPAVDASNLINVPGSNITGVFGGDGLTGGGNSGDITLDVDYGPSGPVQAWTQQLQDLGQLNPNTNWVIIGDGTNFQVQGGLTLQQNLGLEPGVDIMAYSQRLEDIANMDLPTVNSRPGGYTLATADCGNTVTINSASDTTVLIPVLNIGCEIDIVQLGAGQITVNADPPMTIENSFNLFRTRALYSIVSIKVLTGTLAVLGGDIN